MYELLEMTKEVDTPGRHVMDKKEAGYDVMYYMFNNTRFQFPPLKFTESDPLVKTTEEKFCLHLYWQHQNGLEEKRYGMFKDVDNMDECDNSRQKTKLVWPESQPTDGINFKLWYPFVQPNCRGSSSCEEDCQQKLGVIDSEGTCYAYKILKKICAKIGDYQTSQGVLHVAYDEGCFNDDSGSNSIGFYDWAAPSKQHEF